MPKLEELVSAARQQGWASGSGDVESIRGQAASLGWSEVTTRRGDASVSVLRPVDARNARPKSLSAVYGLGQQPLHTDGAHLSISPNVVVLISVRPSSTPTRIWTANRPRRRLVDSSRPSADALQHGMFLVHNGRELLCARSVWRALSI